MQDDQKNVADSVNQVIGVSAENWVSQKPLSPPEPIISRGGLEDIVRSSGLKSCLVSESFSPKTGVTQRVNITLSCKSPPRQREVVSLDPLKLYQPR